MSFTGFKMMFPIIKIRNKDTGHIHIIGTDSHDTLHVGNDGQLHYSNLQNSDGSGSDDEYGYIFEGTYNEWSPYPEVEFVTLDGLIKIMKEQAELSAESEREFRKIVEKIWRKHSNECQKNINNGLIHS